MVYEVFNQRIDQFEQVWLGHDQSLTTQFFLQTILF